MEALRTGSEELCEPKVDHLGLGKTVLGPCLAKKCAFSGEGDAGINMFLGNHVSHGCCSSQVWPSKVLEVAEACGKAEASDEEKSARKPEMDWNGSCDQGNSSLYYTNYDTPGYEDDSCNCHSESSETYPEKENDLCGFACQHWPSGFKEKDASKLPHGREEAVEEDMVSKAKEGLSDCTRAPGGKKVARQQRHRSAAKDKGEGRLALSGGKHRQSRKRSDGGWHPIQGELLKHLEGVASFCVSCFKFFISVIVQVTHRCGEGVEAGGRLLYSCCSFSSCDLDTIRTSMRTWIQHARLGGRKLVQQLSLWMGLTYRLMKMLCAVFFLVLMLLLGSLRLCWQISKSALLGILVRLAHTSHGAWLLSSVDLPKMWALFRESRTCKWVTGLLHKWHTLLWQPKGLRTNQSGEATHNGSPGGSGQYQPGEEVARLLTMAHTPEEELNPFQVLGLEATASDAELKRAYRHLAVLVHPDKNKHPRAEEAFKVLRAAWDIVSNPERRKEYEIKRMAETELTKSMNEFLSKLQDDLKEAMNTMMCNKCQGKHKRFEMDRDLSNARYCAECSKLHAAEEGDFWAESSMLGLKITYFAIMDGKVYDITEWAGCQRVGISPDTHRVPYHISFGSRGSGARQRAPSDSSPASAAELQDFFNRIFQGNPGQMPNGNFFSMPQQSSPGSAPTPPATSSKVDSTSQKGDSKQKRRKKVRRPFQR
ncbi:dnaJ homolog subfamily C member 14 [Tiliqua scincoides]|uniref:dnaJ homolog subfamily C member 14 n=1 Tax=Tiliqua scincoides TaxID=71010 RepID=UPI0034634E1A